MTETQQRIHVSRVEVNSIEFDHEVMNIPINLGEEVSFEFIVINYGNPAHVHLSTSEEIGKQVSFLKDNPYVKYEERIPVILRLPKDGGSQEGEIFVTTGYGSKKKSFKVKMLIKEEKKHEVIVDNKLSKKVTEKPKKRELSGIYSQQEVMVATFTLVLILLSLFLTFYGEDSYPFAGSLLASILIVFLVLYSYKRSISL
ncbi:MAG: hypothetical protein SVM80_00640 [Halobacteriota archaeon]|nr:hypothetical protein [Halobacteriota archaeon]